MAELVALIASCITVASVAREVAHGLELLRDLWNSPSILSVITNEVADLSLVVNEITIFAEKHKDPTTRNSILTLDQVLNHAESSLRELDQLIKSRLILPDGSGQRVRVSRRAWLLEKKNVERLQQRLQTARLDIMAALAVLTM
jgi:hypothetical protein